MSTTGYELYAQAAHMIATIESLEGADPEVLDPQLAAWLDSCDDKIGAYHAVLKRLEIEDGRAWLASGTPTTSRVAVR